MVELVRLYSNPHSEAMRLCRLHRDALSHYRSTAQPAARSPQRVSQRLGQEMLERIVAEYAAGTSTTRLAKSYGVGKGTLLRLIRESGISIRNRGKRG
jgi:hypothetical protein